MRARIEALDRAYTQGGIRPMDSDSSAPGVIMARASEDLLDVVAIGASAGGLSALSTLLADLPREFPAAIVIVIHLDPNRRSLMAPILDRKTGMEVVQAEQGMRLRAGKVYVAPPDHHILVERDRTISLNQAELVHHVRPSVDLLFESIAGACGERATGVILSGAGRDGARGALAIEKRGGTVIIQDPNTADFAGMPQAAVEAAATANVMPLGGIGPALLAAHRGE